MRMKSNPKHHRKEIARGLHSEFTNLKPTTSQSRVSWSWKLRFHQQFLCFLWFLVNPATIKWSFLAKVTMGNEKNAKRASSRPRKRKFRGNQHSKTKSDSPKQPELPIVDSEPQCSSAKKVKPLSPLLSQDDSSKANAFILIDPGGHWLDNNGLLVIAADISCTEGKKK